MSNAIHKVWLTERITELNGRRCQHHINIRTAKTGRIKIYHPPVGLAELGVNVCKEGTADIDTEGIVDCKITNIVM